MNIKQKEKQLLFNNLAIEWNHINLKTTEQFYNSFIRVLINILNNNSSVYLPHFGTFFLKPHKGCYYGDLHGRGIKKRETAIVLKFKPDRKLKSYFNKKNK